ncbi:MAG: hypothetical protein H6659_16100 [Ardenticatenaceae bacterium]|nr:hypothetical protein [Ardenticatenaceae bacterium]
MDNSTDILRKRRRLAEEQLVENSSWRAGLTDEQAQQLLDWALDFVNEAIWQTAVLPAAEADEALDDAVTALVQVMRQVGPLLAQLPQDDADGRRQSLQELAESYKALTGYLPNQEKLEQLVYLPQAWDNEAIFTQLYNLIAWEQEEE